METLGGCGCRDRREEGGRRGELWEFRVLGVPKWEEKTRDSMEMTPKS